MLFNFTYYNPTRIHFGKDSLSKLKEELKNFGETVLLMYGKSSIKKIGLYDEIIKILNESGKKVVELSGVMSNPTYKKVLEGGELVRNNKVDFILAVGGGSVIDCAKAISVSAYCEGDAFKRYWMNFEPITNKIIPVGSVLTMVGTGSEMNGGSVITNEELKIKNGRVYSSEVYPKFSILNPEYTFSVPQYQMVSGIFDIISHLMEQYFSGDDNNTTDYVIEGLLRSVIDNARVAIKNPEDYEARSNIMWSATLALNTMAGLSKTQDWEVHMIEHQLGAYTDCAHGMGLAAISIPYYRYIYSYGLDKFVRFAKNVWNVSEEGKNKDDIAKEGLNCLEVFIKECGMVTSLRELGATKEMLPLIAKSTVLGGGYKKLNAEDILTILEECY
ncbi:iron-containing alcohol dehydrogenase [Clostridium sp.]|uniref:iron-containing alcohol dehydrogenase n=1 Tax=Clostridium sp. TaxID=1506 RepID=UPI0025CC339C|nr:iron-containing alcohol dehydrogenase [uncultured Clostridium sp.]MDU4882412.1 iron-containing alcohol dehydrogenase [Clostridium celatum]MDU7075882.1 iron-containing alcohol dehydrogenase [Clostridium celatum]